MPIEHPNSETPCKRKNQSMNKSILITGASGFIGSTIVDEALQRGLDVWAAVRPTSSRQYLSDPRIHFIELNLGDEVKLSQQIHAHVQENGPWQYVIHAAGATKCRRAEDFARVNTEGTLNLARQLTNAGALSGRFVFISSLSICGALHEDDYAKFTEQDTPQPNTAYGLSKYAAEKGLQRMEGLDYVVLRPTGVYGPRERDYFLMAKSICQHIDFSVGYKKQVITFIYVKDLVGAALSALTQGKTGSAYLLTDGGEYDSRTFSDLLQKETGIKSVLHICAPLWVLHAVCGVAGWWARLLGKTSTLNLDKYKIMKQRNWRCDISLARKELHYEPQYDLARGVKETVAWYKKESWI